MWRVDFCGQFFSEAKSLALLALIYLPHLLTYLPSYLKERYLPQVGTEELRKQEGTPGAAGVLQQKMGAVICY